MPYYKGHRKFQAGNSPKGRAGLVGLQKVSSVAVGNVGAGVDTLITLTIEKDTLYKNGQALRITAWGSFAANGNNKEVILDVGGTTVSDSGVLTDNDKKWMVEAIVIRTGVDTQDVISRFIHDTAIITLAITALTKDDGADIVVKCTGEATATDDIIQEGMLIEVLNA